MSLIEAMAAAAVLAIGILGSFSGMVLASRQNSSAAKMGRASAAAAAVRAGLEVKTYARLNAPTGPLNAANCTGDVNFTDGLGTALPAASCVVDLDIFDAAASPVNKIVPGYSAQDRTALRRLAVVRDIGAPVEFRSVVIVVSYDSGMGRRYVKQSMGVFNPQVNKVGAEP